MGVPGVCACHNKSGFTRNGDSKTFGADENENRQIAIDLDEVADVHWSINRPVKGPAKILVPDTVEPLRGITMPGVQASRSPAEKGGANT